MWRISAVMGGVWDARQEQARHDPNSLRAPLSMHSEAALRQDKASKKGETRPERASNAAARPVILPKTSKDG
jgi:hypothetical protein